MILNVIIEPTDPIEIHQRYEELYMDSHGGYLPIVFSGKFRFEKDFEVEQQHKNSQLGNGRITRFKLLSVYEELYPDIDLE